MCHQMIKIDINNKKFNLCVYKQMSTKWLIDEERKKKEIQFETLAQFLFKWENSKEIEMQTTSAATDYCFCIAGISLELSKTNGIVMTSDIYKEKKIQDDFWKRKKNDDIILELFDWQDNFFFIFKKTIWIWSFDWICNIYLMLFEIDYHYVLCRKAFVLGCSILGPCSFRKILLY